MKVSVKIIFLILISTSFTCFSQKKTSTKAGKVPFGKIIDRENLFSADQITDLETRTISFSKFANLPLGIMTVPMPAKMKPYREWTVKKAINTKGLFIAINQNVRQISYGVGPEFSTKISDTKIEEIIIEIVIPEFKNEKYYIGMSKCVDQLQKYFE